jgi:nucleoside-diphosphate-sugar epimerase
MHDHLEGRRILVTGATGQVALPVTRALARSNEVIALARFRDPDQRADLEGVGVRCAPVDLADPEFASVPPDVDIVLHFAVIKSGRWDVDLRANAEATGLLMAHCSSADAFLHCSSTGVYHPAGHHALVETDPLGDNHRALMETYSISKIAAEAVVRTECRQLSLPTTIVRLNVPYGDNGGWPSWHLEMILAGMPVAVSPDHPDLFNPIHEDDIIRMLPTLVAAATVPATIVNLGGDDTVALEEWCEFLGGLVDRPVSFEVTDATISSVSTDNSKRRTLAGDTQVAWRDGFERMVRSRHPELFDARSG